jgi:hypothetical protein
VRAVEYAESRAEPYMLGAASDAGYSIGPAASTSGTSVGV